MHIEDFKYAADSANGWKNAYENLARSNQGGSGVAGDLTSWSLS